VLESGLKGHEDLLARFGLKAAAEYYADPVNTPVQLNLAILPRFMLCDNPGDFSNFGPASRLGDAFVRNQYPYAHFTDFPAATLQALFTFKDTKPLGLLVSPIFSFSISFSPFVVLIVLLKFCWFAWFSRHLKFLPVPHWANIQSMHLPLKFPHKAMRCVSCHPFPDIDPSYSFLPFVCFRNVRELVIALTASCPPAARRWCLASLAPRNSHRLPNLPNFFYLIQSFKDI
jgi:hypothetical protein